MMDNSLDAGGARSIGQGTAQLSTTCTQGQVIPTWIIHPIVGATAARISNIHFIDREVCGHLQKVYGAPAVAVSPPYLPGLTPTYDYWAGLVLPDPASRPLSLPTASADRQQLFERGDAIVECRLALSPPTYRLPDNLMRKGIPIVDVQNDYFPGGAFELSGMADAAENCRKLLQGFQMVGAPVIHVQHRSVQPAAQFFLPETEGSAIHDSVRPTAGEAVIVKVYPNAFRETWLLDVLRRALVSPSWWYAAR